MNKMDRRSFLKGMGYTAAVVAGETAAGKLTRKGVAYGSSAEKPAMVSMVAVHGIERASFIFYTDHKSRLVAAGPGGAEREAVFDIVVNPISISTVPIRLAGDHGYEPYDHCFRRNQWNPRSLLGFRLLCGSG